MEMAPDIYYQTDHFKGWPGLLARLDVIEELSRHRGLMATELAAKRPLLEDALYFLWRFIPSRGDFMQTMTRRDVGFSYDILPMPRLVMAGL